MASAAYYLGIDVGTSGIRAIIIDNNHQVLATCIQAMPQPEHPQPLYYQQDPAIWWQTLQTVLSQLAAQFDFKKINSLSLDATSGTVLLVNQQGEALSTALMYNDQRAIDYVEKIKQHAPKNSPCATASSGLAKMLWLLDKHLDLKDNIIAHQADWLCSQLSWQYHYTDSNNALKTGYDPITNEWPTWLAKLGIQQKQLPKVSCAGTLLFPLATKIIQQFGFHKNVQLVSGTTDSTAALLATGACKIGDAVTSLGSTLVLKIISDKPIFSDKEGIYSQPFGTYWLVGGASNSGGAVLRHFFTDEQMSQLEAQLNIKKPTNLHYYPLLQAGERFPINNPKKMPALSPRPKSDALFFQALLEGITSIEQQGYKKLQQLGAPSAKRLFSIGGGTVNTQWMAMRQQSLNIPMCETINNNAAFGAALLAKQGYDKA